MNKTRRTRPPVSLAYFEDRYSIELARGSSHIASTLGLDSLRAAVAESMDDFLQRNGTDDLAIFLEVLADRLDKRHASDAASLVRQFCQERLRVGPAHRRQSRCC
jgi:hypothetical protein